MPPAWIFLTLSHYFSLLLITYGRSSGLHPISSQSCCMYVWAGCPAFAQAYVGGPQEYITYELIPASPAVSCMSGSSNLDSFCYIYIYIYIYIIYGCTTWTLTKRMEKKLDGNYTKMLQAIFNKSWRQHATKHQLYGHLPPIMKTIQVRQTR